MTFTTTAGSAEYVAQGPMGVKGIYTTKRKYSLSDLIVYQDRTWAKFDWILRDKLSVITVDDPQPKVLTKQETPIKFDVKTDGADTTYEGDTVKISDTLAKFLQANDILECPNLFCDSDGANYTTTKFGSGYHPETMTIVSNTLSGIAAGVAKVIVRRGNGYSTAAPAAGTVLTILSEYKLVKIGNALEENANAPTAIHHEPTALQDCCQFFSKTWAEGETESNTNVFGKETMAQKGERKRKDLLREIENALLFGRYGTHTVSGQNQYVTGGIVEYMPAAATALDGVSRLINFGGAFDPDTGREKAEITFAYGSETKWAFAGGKLLSVLWSAYEKYVRMNDGLSRKWGWPVWEIDWGHGIMQIMRHPLLREKDSTTTAYAYDCIIVDPEFVWLMILANMDLQTKTNVQDPGAHYQKNELYGQLGLRRTHPTAHAYWYGITG